MNRNHYERLQANLLRFFLFSACIILLIFSSGVTFGEITGTQGKDSAPNYRKARKRKVVSKLLLKANPITILSDGSTASTITAKVKNKKGKPVKGVKIRFKAVGKGTLSSKTSKTGSDGKATTTVTSTKTGKLTITAKTKNVKPTKKRLVNITVKSSGGSGGGAANLSLKTNQSTIGNDGASTATFTAELVNSNNNAITDSTITFKTDHGKITPSAVTDSSGFATAVLTSESVYTGTITVTATYDTDTVTTATIISVESSQTTSFTVVSDKTAIAADGTSSAIISAQLKNEKNNPIVGATIEFSAKNGGTITGSAKTNSWGIAEATLKSNGYLGDIVVTASFNNKLTASTTIQSVAAGVLNLAITASPSNITSDGTDSSEVKLTVTDGSGFPVSGQKVDFRNALDVDSDGTISAGDTIDSGTLSKTSGTTDSSGAITTTLTSVVTGTIVVEADVNGSVKNISIDAVAAGGVKKASLSAGSDSILVNTGSTTITATFTNITSGNAVFASSLGTLSSNVAAIDGSGVASVTLNAGDLTGISTVKVSYNDGLTDTRIESTVNVTITSDTPSAISITATPDNIAKGSGISTIRAFVQDSDGNPVANIAVGFTLVNSPGGDEHLEPAGTLVFTGPNGMATAKFLAGKLTTGTFNNVKIDAYVVNSPSIKSSTFLTISGPDAKPVAPTGLAAAVNLSSGVEVTLTWNDNSDNEVGFSIERAEQGSFYAEIAVVGAGAKSYLDNDSTLVLGNVYYYRVRAFSKGALDSGDENSFSDYSQEISVDTLVETTVTISLTGNKLSIGNDGTSTATFTAELINSNNNPIAGSAVKFATNHGKITSASVTDSSGFATAVLTSEKNYVGTITVSAVYGTNTTTTATIDSVDSGQTTSLVISADKASISADGTSTAIISAQLRNEKNNPIVGATIEFASEKGTITGSAATDSWGIAKATLISENFNGDVVVTASYNNGEITAFLVVKFVAAGVLNLAITADPANITADGADTSEVKLTITDASGNPVSGQKIDFRNALDVDSDGTISVGDTIDYGTLSKTSGTTDSNGIITTTLSSTLTGSIVVEADANGSVKNVSVDAVAAGQVKSATLTAGASSILVNTGSTTITATFTNITSGNAVFAASLGTLSANVAAIDGSGIASVTLNASDLTGVSTVKVSYYDAVSDKRIESTINVTITSDTPTAISVKATPDNIAKGSGVATITAFVQDSDGNPVTNIGVGFTLVNSPGGDEHLVPDGTLLFTDANGIATVKFLAGELTTPIFNGVKIDAYVATDTSIKSSTFLTISGAPFHVALVFNDYLTPLNLNGDGTLSCPIAALVTDIHGNPVADGTLVSFGVATTQIVALESDIGFDVNGDSDTGDKVLLSSEDINGNGSLDSGEDLNGNRVIDIVEDINGNGVLDIAEDLNNNGVLDSGEDANNNGLLDINEDVNANGTLDVNISADAIATKSSTTVKGVATGDLRYGVNFVERFQVRLTAESGGVTDGDGQYVILPARDPNTGWNITKQSTFITNINIDTANLPAPTGLAGTAASSSQIDITWTDNSSSETAFSIERKDGKFGSFEEVATVVSNTVSYSDTALDANTPYYYRVRALNQLNSTFSAFSTEVTVTTKNEKPDAPTGLDATAISTNQINLTWNEWSSNESVFAVFRSTDISAITIEIGTVGKNIESYSDNTASKNTTYYYQVTARNSAGDSSRTNIASATTPDTKPVAPTGLAATVALATGVEVTLTWNDNSDNEVGFSIERAEQGGFYSEIAIVGAGASTYLDDDSSIVPGDIYYYRVRAFSKGALENGDENSFSDYSQELSVDTLIETLTPNSPTNLSATSPASTQVNLTWDDNSLNETSFAVSRATSSGGPFTEIDTTSSNSTSYSDTSASANTTYYYKVVARNAAGDSSATNTVSETTVDFQPQAPSGLTATASTTNKVEINLSWTDNSSNEIGFSIERAEESNTNNGIGDYKVIFIAEANATSYTDDDSTLTDKAYYYRVRAFSNGAVYSVYSDEVSAAPIAVSAPTGLSGTTGTTTGVNLNWTDASSNETAFAIEFKKSSTGAWSEVALVSANSTGVIDLIGTTFVVGDTYIFRVRAFNGIYYSKYSNEIAAVVK